MLQLLDFTEINHLVTETMSVAQQPQIAERILTLGYSPEYRYSEYISKSAIAEASQTEDGKKDVESILNSFSILIEKQRAILDASGKADDEGTNSLMSDYIREQEKLVWMYSAFLNK